MTAEEFSTDWFSLVEATLKPEEEILSTPITGIKINLDGIHNFQAQSTFRFTEELASKNANLKNLILSKGKVDEENPENSTYKEYELTPEFDKDTLEYEVTLMEYIDTMDIKAILEDETSTMKIKVPKRDEDDKLLYEDDGVTIVTEEKDLANDTPLEFVLNKLGEPDTELVITVTAEDGKTTKEYKLVIKRPYGSLKGKIYTEPTTFTTEKHIAEVLAYLDKNLQGIVDWDTVINNTKASDDLNAVLRGDGTSENTGIAESRKLTTNDDGTFEMYLSPGTYHLLIDKKGYLDQIYINIEITEGKIVNLSENEPDEHIQLTPGDINKDSSVSILDKTIMTKQNGKNETDNLDFNPSADLNDDGKINITDKTILTKNNNLKRKIINLKGGNE